MGRFDFQLIHDYVRDVHINGRKVEPHEAPFFALAKEIDTVYQEGITARDRLKEAKAQVARIENQIQDIRLREGYLINEIQRVQEAQKEVR